MERALLPVLAILLAACGVALDPVQRTPPVSTASPVPPAAAPGPSAAPPTPSPSSGSAAAVPRGIFALDSQAGTYRDANIRALPFVTGYAWRMGWASFETAKDVYDFAPIDHIVRKLQAVGQRLSLQMLAPPGHWPAYLAEAPGAVTWTFTDQNPRHEGYGVPVKRPVPWDAFTQERYRIFLRALGDHLVPNAAAGGALVPFRDHSVLAHVGAVIPGLGFGSIREDLGVEVADLPGYSREKLTAAIVTDLAAVTDAFPRTPVSIGFWSISDRTASPALWEQIGDAVLREFDGVRRPTVGFYQENLAASRATAGAAVRGTPTGPGVAPLQRASTASFVTFQMLQSWVSPFADRAKTANTTPLDAIRYAHETFGTAYVEVYAQDLDERAWWPLFTEWAAKLRGP